MRKLCLDELPQLWNVLLGEMSLVGPRPIVEEEVHYYGDRFELYSLVLPGITGFWQVSGRNDTSYEKRVCLDEFYVRNWSIWLDIYILARTVSVVLLRKGAY
jgi:lipopolysaccharide/colanic/teichoic acid biosynthesis glycosyltransferase